MQSWKSFIPKDSELARIVQTLKEYFTQLDKHDLLKTNPGKGESGQVLTSQGTSGNPIWTTLETTSSGGSISIDCGSITAPNENVSIDCGGI